jgi:ribonucleotide reductase alpha subunit
LKEECSRIGGGTAVLFNLRCDGASIKGINGIGAGTVPVLGINGLSTQYVTQASGRGGAGANYFHVFNKDLSASLQLKGTKQDDTSKNTSSKQMFFGVLLNDLFFKKVKLDQNIALFCMAETDILFHINDPEEFEQCYNNFIELGYAKAMVNAKACFKEVVDAALLNGDPYLISIDNANKLSMQIPRNNQGDILTYADVFDIKSPNYSPDYAQNYFSYLMIMQSNLCAEVVQPTDSSKAGGKIPASHSVCNLASVNVPFALTNLEKPSDNLSGFYMVLQHVKNEICGMYLKEFDPYFKKYILNYHPDALNTFSFTQFALFESQFKSIIDTHLDLCSPTSLDDTQLVGSINSFEQKHKLWTIIQNKWKTIHDKLFTLFNTAHPRHHSVTIKNDQTDLLFHNMRQHLWRKLDQVIDFVANLDMIICCFIVQMRKPEMKKQVDYSLLFYSGWMATTISDAYVGYTHNLPHEMHKYQDEFRSVIVGICGMADLRIGCEISYMDMDQSLYLETSTMESIQFGGILASTFMRIACCKTPYKRFYEGALSKGFFHHDLYGKYFGGQKDGENYFNQIKFEESQVELWASVDQYYRGGREREFIDDKIVVPRLLQSSSESSGDENNRPPNEDNEEFPMFYGSTTRPIESGIWIYTHIRKFIKQYGLKNSTITGNMPTSNSSNVSGYNPSVQPIQGIYLLRSGVLGETVEISWSSVSLLKKYKCWNNEVKNFIAANKGSVKGCPRVSIKLQRILATAYEIQPHIIVIHNAQRGAFTCQSSSNNNYLPKMYSNPESYMEILTLAHENGTITLSYYTHTETVLSTTNFSTMAAGLTNTMVEKNNLKAPIKTLEPVSKSTPSTDKMLKKETKPFMASYSNLFKVVGKTEQDKTTKTNLLPSSSGLVSSTNVTTKREKFDTGVVVHVCQNPGPDGKSCCGT